MHGFRFTYYERYEELMKEGRSESNARAEATAAAETAVKNAVLPYKARPTPAAGGLGTLLCIAVLSGTLREQAQPHPSV
jgi:hypothetical protein